MIKSYTVLNVHIYIKLSRSIANNKMAKISIYSHVTNFLIKYYCCVMDRTIINAVKPVCRN